MKLISLLCFIVLLFNLNSLRILYKYSKQGIPFPIWLPICLGFLTPGLAYEAFFYLLK